MDVNLPNIRYMKNKYFLKSCFELFHFSILNMGEYEVSWLDDDWTVVTDDGSFSAHYENTILITEGEPEILTLHGQE